MLTKSTINQAFKLKPGVLEACLKPLWLHQDPVKDSRYALLTLALGMNPGGPSE